MNTKILSIFSIAATLLVVILISGCVQTSGGQNQTNPQTGVNSIEIKNFAFAPSEITIKKGETVTWTNKDSANHKIISDTGNEIDSPSLSDGQSYSHTFNQVGTFEYHCSIHPSMKAKVIVE